MDRAFGELARDPDEWTSICCREVKSHREDCRIHLHSCSTSPLRLAGNRDAPHVNLRGYDFKAKIRPVSL
jgi:hypothetical protein